MLAYAGVWCGGSAGVTAKAQQQERAMDRLRLLLEASEKRVLSLLASGLYFCTSKASKASVPLLPLRRLLLGASEKRVLSLLALLVLKYKC